MCVSNHDFSFLSSYNCKFCYVMGFTLHFISKSQNCLLKVHAFENWYQIYSIKISLSRFCELYMYLKATVEN